MDTKELIRFGNFIVELQVENENHSAVVMRDLSSTWETRIRSNNTLFSYWVQFASGLYNDELSDEQKDSLKTAFEATVIMLFQLSNIGLHDVALTNKLAEAVDEHNKLIEKILDESTDKEQEEKDASDWMERQQVMDDMQKAIEDEHTDNQSGENAV